MPTGTHFQDLLPEILGQIFYECLPDDSQRNVLTKLPVEQAYPSSLSAANAPLNVGRVCSHWRSVAQTTPCLWARIAVTVNEEDEENAKDGRADLDFRCATMAKVFASRSGCLPLTIIFLFSFQCRRLMRHYIKELVLHARRWRSLKLATYQGAAQPFFQALRDGVPKLEALEIRLHEMWNPTIEVELLHCPRRLTSVRLRGGMFSLSKPTTALENLRALHVMGFSPQPYSWLPHCPALEHLTVIFHDTIFRSMNDDRFDLPHLITLRLCVGYHSITDGMEDFLDHLRAPNLKTLEFGLVATHQEPELYGANQLDLYPFVRNFLNRSNLPMLESLCFEFPCISVDHLMEFLRDFPSLKHIGLCCDLIPERVVEALMWRDGMQAKQRLCPELEEISFMLKERITLHGSKTLSLVHTWCSHALSESNGVPIGRKRKVEEVVITYSRAYAETFKRLFDEQKIEPYVARGLRVQLHPTSHMSSKVRLLLAR